MNHGQGEPPACLEDVEDENAKQFIKKLIGPATERPSAKELLEDPFLEITDSDKQQIKTGSRRIVGNVIMLINNNHK